MKKNAVKINESTLRRIVAENVRKVISEVDWKTYRNAQEKNREREPEYEENYWKLQDAIEAAHKRGDDKEVQKLQRKQEALVGKSMRTAKFGSASNDAFNDKFFANSHDRFNKQNGESFAPFKNTDDGSYSTPEPWIDDNGNIHNGHYFDGHGKTDGKYFDDTIEYSKLGGGYGNVTYDGEMNGNDNTAYSDEELKSLGIPDNEFNDIEKARREIRRYRNGDYTYDKEKGWHLKESVLRKIVAESVKKVLKEGEFDNNYKTCLQHISAALKAIEDVWKGEDNGYDENSEYTRQYNDMLGQLHNHLRDAFFVAKELAANGREGDFDASGYHTAGF